VAVISASVGPQPGCSTRTRPGAVGRKVISI